jgi:hypothetical protein
LAIGKRQLQQAMKNKYLFLDFDGVLHPDRYSLTNYDPDRVFKNNEIFSQAPILAGLLTEFPCQIVISSSWRFTHSLEEMKAKLPKAIAKTVVGMTGDAYVGPHPRYNEIKEYLTSRNKSLFAWRALDDSKLEFPNGCTDLILCDPNTGITTKQIQELKKWLQK